MGMNRRQMLAALAVLPLTDPLGAATHAATPAEDMAILRAAMSIHPGLYRYSTPALIERRLSALEAVYAKALARGSTADAYLALSRFLATIRCGHSYCNFFNQNDARVTELFARSTILPLHFRWIDRAMVVLADRSGTNSIPPGSRIERLNGEGAGALLDRLMPLVRADGGNDGKRRALLSVAGAETIETFDVFQGLIAPPTGGVHRIEALLPDGKMRRVDLPAVNLAARRAMMTRVPDTSDGVRWGWAMRPDGIAVLDMPGWALYDSKWNWQAWLSDRLDSLSGARGLIIDIRANEGGNDCGDPILARLIDADLPGVASEQRLRFTSLPPILAPHVSTWDPRFKTMGVGAKPLGSGFYERPGGARLTTIARADKRITVPVAALIGPTNSSATFQFANLCKASGKVRLFGEETGGNRRGINGGAFFFTTLPASGIEFDLPLVGYFPTGRQPDAGIAPDVSVRVTARDIASGEDRAMAAASAWIAREIRLR